MKKRLKVLISMIAILTLVGCGNKQSGNVITEDIVENDFSTNESLIVENTMEEADTQPQEEVTIDQQGASSIVVYYSWSGNTEAVAQEIQSQINADVFKLEPVNSYSEDYNTVLEEAQEERRNDARPEFVGSIADFEAYDIVFLGYPNWWADMPMIIYSFLEEYDLAGKTILPFVTHGGSGFSGTVNTIRQIEPDATVLEGLSIRSSGANSVAEAVATWLTEQGITQ